MAEEVDAVKHIGGREFVVVTAGVSYPLDRLQRIACGSGVLLELLNSHVRRKADAFVVPVDEPSHAFGCQEFLDGKAQAIGGGTRVHPQQRTRGNHRRLTQYQ